jgi:hypothetical protein
VIAPAIGLDPDALPRVSEIDKIIQNGVLWIEGHPTVAANGPPETKLRRALFPEFIPGEKVGFGYAASLRRLEDDITHFQVCLTYQIAPLSKVLFGIAKSFQFPTDDPKPAVSVYRFIEVLFMIADAIDIPLIGENIHSSSPRIPRLLLQFMHPHMAKLAKNFQVLKVEKLLATMSIRHMMDIQCFGP